MTDRETELAINNCTENREKHFITFQALVVLPNFKNLCLCSPKTGRRLSLKIKHHNACL